MVELEGRAKRMVTNETSLIAPCGIYCGACRAFLRKRNRCPGCRADESEKPETKVICRIKNCAHLEAGGGFCGGCGALFPCEDFKRLENRYKKKYRTNITENLLFIRKHGAVLFSDKEKKDRKCTVCGGTVCMHTFKCPDCGKEIPQA